MKKVKLKLKIAELEDKLTKAEEIIRIQNKRMQKSIDQITNELLLVNQDLRSVLETKTKECEELKQEDMERELLMRRMIRGMTRDVPGNASGKELQKWGNTAGVRPFEESPLHSVAEKETFCREDKQ